MPLRRNREGAWGSRGNKSLFGDITYTPFRFLKIIIALFRKTRLQIATTTSRSGFLGYVYLRLRYEYNQKTYDTEEVRYFRQSGCVWASNGERQETVHVMGKETRS